MTLVTIECSRPGAIYSLFESGPVLDLHLAGPSQHGTGPILCGFDRFARDENGRMTVGFSVGGGTSGPGVEHHVCAECARLAGDEPIHGTNAAKFASEPDVEGSDHG